MQVGPHIMLRGGVVPDAVALWQRAFATLTATAPDDPMEVWRIKIGGQEFTVFDSPAVHDFGPTPAWSFMVDVDSAAEVQDIADILAKDGSVLMPLGSYDFAECFAWVADRFGISWQLRCGPRP
ncbi:MAG: VOC family protein [Pseudomonadota bacterium]